MSFRYAAIAGGCTLALASASLSAHDLPLGDGRISTSPQAGSVFACQSRFRGGGAEHAGDWIQGDRWDPARKPHVAGRVYWPQARYTQQLAGDTLKLEGNNLPLAQATGQFPIAADDGAYRYDHNPNSIREQELHIELPTRPRPATQPGCLPMGLIGVTSTGVAIYNALDAAGRDAAAHEVQDLCDGHPQRNGQYHYHSASPCLPGADGEGPVGWALDGYPILGWRDHDGRELDNAALDACHGRSETITVAGRRYDYAYRLTREYPYTLSCFHGEVAPSNLAATRLERLPPPGRGR